MDRRGTRQKWLQLALIPLGLVALGVILRRTASQALPAVRSKRIGFLKRRIYFLSKRVIDIVVAALILVLISPLMLLISILIRLDSPGPAIFAQERIGTYVKYKNGQKYWELHPFIVYKFRTMRHNADHAIHKAFVKALIEGDELTMTALQNGSGSQSAPSTVTQSSYKLRQDTRVTRLGKVLRKLSLDELPQFWNVLKGDMSLVGPRPPLAYEVELYSPDHMRRLESKPGLTGLWQVSARSAVDFDRMVALDVYYVDHQSFLMDLSILLKTPFVVLKARGAA